MPIYEYECKKCGVFEAMQKITDAPLKKCPTCKGKVERIVSRTSFVLKGSGWYQTDYAKKGPSASSDETAKSSAASEKAANGTSSSESSSTSKSESKPAKEKKAAAKSAD